MTSGRGPSIAKVRSGRSTERSLATAAVRRARAKLGLSQKELAQRLDTTDRVVRRRESGRSDLGVLESALKHPAFARALAEEILRVVDREQNNVLPFPGVIKTKEAA